ncbi:MAG: hypothetical protein M1821_003981 [Bathelium mastoideum]|nr:MAG: hypothetical protein M1821_003981 [Bathelium mastoideum]
MHSLPSSSSPSRPIGSLVFRPAVYSIVKLLCLFIAQLPTICAAPLDHFRALADVQLSTKELQNGEFWAYIGIAIALVLLGGAFAGLTIALMGQDEIYLQVIKEAGEGAERKQATSVLRLLKKGKHWVLVTLLLSNVITNETLPIILDRSIGGGWPAVLSSTVLIVIFGEVAPQSVCVRYGLPIGAFMAPFVLCLMWILAPVAWPTAKLLDWLLGEDHGTIYKKAGLKTLVTLHRTMGHASDERLSQDEVTIISAVLDLKQKPVGNIMTPMNDVFTMSADTVLDEKMMDVILSAGYSRIPIYHPDNPRNFVGMLLVKILITYDPEDCLRVRDFALATLPETSPKTSCLDIVNFFQEGKSHMVLVSDFPGESYGALGVVTLEDVIEELIGEEIIDESDVFVDVHKAIRRITPAPRTRMPRSEARDSEAANVDATDTEYEGQRPKLEYRATFSGPVDDTGGSRKPSLSELGKSPGRAATLLMRRKSSTSGSTDPSPMPVSLRSGTPELRQHLRHLGPSNVASRPRQTKFTNVKIKPGVGTIPENKSITPRTNDNNAKENQGLQPTAPEGGVGEGLLANSGQAASDGVQALSQGYGTMHKDSAPLSHSLPNGNHTTEPQADLIDLSHPSHGEDGHYSHDQLTTPSKIVVDLRPPSQQSNQSNSSPNQDDEGTDAFDPDRLGAMRNHERRRSARSTGRRSGSITENIVEQDGVKKIVLEFAGSEAEEEDEEDGGDVAAGDELSSGSDRGSEQRSPREGVPVVDGAEDAAEGAAERGGEGKRKKRKKRGKKKGKGRSVSPEKKPLLR